MTEWNTCPSILERKEKQYWQIKERFQCDVFVVLFFSIRFRGFAYAYGVVARCFCVSFSAKANVTSSCFGQRVVRHISCWNKELIDNGLRSLVALSWSARKVSFMPSSSRNRCALNRLRGALAHTCVCLAESIEAGVGDLRATLYLLGSCVFKIYFWAKLEVVFPSLFLTTNFELFGVFFVSEIWSFRDFGDIRFWARQNVITKKWHKLFVIHPLFGKSDTSGEI